MTSSQEKAYKLRHCILIVGVVFTLAGLVWVLLPIFCDIDANDSKFSPMGLLGTVLAFHPFASNGELGYAINIVVVTTLILAGTVLIWAFGPGIILLYLREKYRRGKLIEQEPGS